MLRNVSDIRGYQLQAKDGDIGHCKDFLFDDERWTVRYMVADTGNWLPGRKVLISPISLDGVEEATKTIPVKLTCEEIENGPPLEKDAPVSRQYEIKWYKHYCWPSYWVGAEPWGPAAYPAALFAQGYPQTALSVDPSEAEDPEENHLRSTDEVEGYHISASDGDIGHVESFVVDTSSWVVRYIIVDTRNYLPGKKVLIAPAWVENVDWSTRKVAVPVPADAVANAPTYDPAITIDREYEQALYDYYKMPAYWL